MLLDADANAVARHSPSTNRALPTALFAVDETKQRRGRTKVWTAVWKRWTDEDGQRGDGEVDRSRARQRREQRAGGGR
jgi:hypothetical protein